MKKKAVLALAALIVLVAGTIVIKQKASAPSQPATTKQQSTESSLPEGFNKTLYSNTDPNSIWVVVNKSEPLNPASYAPADLVVPDVPLRLSRTEEQMQIRKPVEQSIKDMFAAAKQSGFQLSFGSGYRSYKLQKQFYDGYVATKGRAEADRISARPSYSEHQTGLAFDVEITDKKCHLEKCLADTPDGKWIAGNAYKYGFIIRYPVGKESVTGYDFEPWHLRYVGMELAQVMQQQNISTLEEFFDIAGGANY